jgi:hypothetical protein
MSSGQDSNAARILVTNSLLSCRLHSRLCRLRRVLKNRRLLTALNTAFRASKTVVLLILTAIQNQHRLSTCRRSHRDVWLPSSDPAIDRDTLRSFDCWSETTASWWVSGDLFPYQSSLAVEDCFLIKVRQHDEPFGPSKILIPGWRHILRAVGYGLSKRRKRQQGCNNCEQCTFHVLLLGVRVNRLTGARCL